MVGHVTVSVVHGILRGREDTTLSGGPLICFQGIPYAKPPVGELRFKAPQPLKPWSGVRDALSEGPVSPQKDEIFQEFRGEEDCLYLNVYTPQLPKNRMQDLRPVMVWVHGGGFMVGSGNAIIYGPDYLVDAGMVLVTFNYRLGPLGFLSLENEDIPGNAGMKDQVAALRWVKQNIHNFGGDTNNITIFGESAGGASVHHLMLSPMTKGLFHRAISQSGCALNPWAFSRSTLAKAFQLGEILGCKTDDPKELFEVLKTAEPRAMVDAMEKMQIKLKQSGGLAILLMPTLEPEVSGQEAFLVREPFALIKEGRFHHVPYMAGVTSHEGILLITEVLKNSSLLKKIDADFQRLVPNDLKAEQNPWITKTISDKIRNFYFGFEPLSNDTIEEYIHLNTDLNFAIGVHKTVQQQSALSTAPTYYYQFLFDGALGFLKQFLGAGKISGASHGDDIGYLFRLSMLELDLDPQSPEVRTRNRMVKMWTNFAKTGNPTSQLDNDITIDWKPYSISNPGYLSINTALSMRQDLEKKRMDFWEELYRSKL